MLNLFHDIYWSFQQGKLHELFLRDGITFATWGLVVVTLALVVDSWRKGKEQRLRWKREDEQRQNDRDEERARWKRDDQLRTALRLESLFNAPTLIVVRRRTGAAMLGRNSIAEFRKDVPASGEPVIGFFVRIADLWEKNQLDLKDVDIAYRRHVLHIWRSFEKHLVDEHNQARYSKFKKLYDELLKIDPTRRLDGLAAVVSTEHEEFWKSESEL